MRFDQISGLMEEDFRRLTGVKKETFFKMIEELEKIENLKKKTGGRPNKLSIEDRLLMTLTYLREYRTLFHIGQSYGISESVCQRTIVKIEDILVKSGLFALPGKKALLKSDLEYEVILADATETPIERPKKNKKNTIQGKKNDIR
jgi:hypothetical protein